MSLVLENLIWTIPGTVFLFSYSRIRDVESVELSGWGFVFLVVLVGAVTIYPVEYFTSWTLKQNPLSVVLSASLIAFFIPFVLKWIFRPFVNKLVADPTFFDRSAFWSMLYFFYPTESNDRFVRNCIQLEGLPVFVVLDKTWMGKKTEDKDSVPKQEIYLGILIEFPYSETKHTETHVINILPLLRGYKNLDTGEVSWKKAFNPYKYKNKQSEECGLVIPRANIAQFFAYDEDQHKDLCKPHV